jgi:hypothetical protein
MPLTNRANAKFKGLSALFSSRAGGGGGPPDALRTIGALTRVGAGGRAIPAANGTYGPYTVASGIMTPNTAPVTPGTYNVGGVTITAEADTYDVGTGQLAAVIALGSAALDGKTIKVLPGADACGAATGSSVSLGTGISLTNPLTITSRDTSNQGFVRRFVLTHGGQLILRQVKVRDTFVLAADTYGATRIINFGNNAGGRSRLWLDECECYSNDIGTINTTLLASGTNAATASGTLISFSNSPDLSSVPTDRSATILVGGSLRTIVGVDNIAKTVTVSSSITVTSVSYTIGFTPQILRITGQDGSITNPPDLMVTNCHFHDVEKALTGLHRSVDIQDTLFDTAYSDHTSFSVNGSETKFDIINNVFGRASGLGGDPLNPHVDDMQLNTGPMTVDNTVPYRFIGNVSWSGPDGRARDKQFIFLENIPSGRRVLAEIEHNITITKSVHGVSVERPAAGTVIRGNTTIRDATSVDIVGLVPAIATISGTYPTDDLAGTLVEYNVSGFVDRLNATEVGNYEFGSALANNEAADYAAVFAGAAADFNTDNLTTAAQVRAALTPDTTALWPVGRVRRGAMSGYYDYTTKVEDAPWDEAGWSASRAWGNVTGATVNTPVASSKIQVTGVSATGTALVVSGGIAPSITIYDTDGTTVIVSGVPDACALNGQWVEVRDTASGTGLTLSTVTIRAGTTTGTWTHETAAAAYSPVAVELDGTNDWMGVESGFTSTGGKQALVAFSVYVPTAWPSSAATVVQFVTAGGNIQLAVELTSSGRLLCSARNATNTVIGGFTAAVSSFVADTWYTILVALDTNTGKGWQVYSRPAGGSWGVVASSSATFTVDGIMAACTRCRVGASSAAGGTRLPNSYLADVWATIDETLDLSVGANRDKFLPLTDKGTGGGIPTGTAPRLFLSGPVASWHTNDGTGGGLTLYGALTAAPSTPT